MNFTKRKISDTIHGTQTVVFFFRLQLTTECMESAIMRAQNFRFKHNINAGY